MQLYVIYVGGMGGCGGRSLEGKAKRGSAEERWEGLGCRGRMGGYWRREGREVVRRWTGQDRMGLGGRWYGERGSATSDHVENPIQHSGTSET